MFPVISLASSDARHAMTRATSSGSAMCIRACRLSTYHCVADDAIIVGLDGSILMTTTFIRHPGLSGPFGALMDEYARAAEDFCRVVDSFDLARFDAERPSNNPNTVSARAICLHVIGAAHRYAHYMRKARGVDFVERYEADAARLHSPRDIRALLTEGIVLTEETVEPLLKATEQEIQALSFTVRWGPRYDPEMILEHAVCHLLRHRRQLERW